MRNIAKYNKSRLIFLVILLCMFSPGLIMRIVDLKDMPIVAWCEYNSGGFGLYQYRFGHGKRRVAPISMKNLSYLGNDVYIGYVSEGETDFRGIAFFDAKSASIEPLLDRNRIHDETNPGVGGSGHQASIFVSGDKDRIYFDSGERNICCYHRDEDRIEVLAESGGDAFWVTKDESYLYYRGENTHLIKKNLGNGNEETILKDVAWFAVSNDGSYIAHMRPRGPLELYDTETTESVVIRSRFQSNTDLLFSKENKYLLYIDYKDYYFLGYRTETYIYNMETRRSHKVHTTHRGTIVEGRTWKEE